MTNSLLSHEWFRAIVDHAYDAVVILDQDNQVQYWNVAAEKMLGYRADNVIGLPVPDSILPDLDDRDSKDDSTTALMGDSLADNWQQIEFHALRADGSPVWVDIRTCRLQYQRTHSTVAIFHDVDVRKRQELELQHQATTDYLSGIANRREFQRVLEASEKQSICVAIIDIDRFKQINDQYGHLIGDQVIRFLAAALVDYFTSAMCVARLGGEEFGIILPLQGQPGDLFDKFCQFVATRHATEQQVHLTISVGVAVSQRSGNDARSLLTVADNALYQSKQLGRNRATVIQVD